MRVMVIVKANKDSEAGVLPDEKILTEMGKFNEELEKAGILLAAEGLQASSKGVRVRFSGGKKTVIDGPFAETKELVAGFWLWQVKSKEEAIEWLKRAPFDETEVEIRQVFEAEDFGEAFTPEIRSGGAQAGVRTRKVVARPRGQGVGLLRAGRLSRSATRAASLASPILPANSVKVGVAPRQRSVSTSSKSGASVSQRRERLEEEHALAVLAEDLGRKLLDRAVAPDEPGRRLGPAAPQSRVTVRGVARPGRGSRGCGPERRRTCARTPSASRIRPLLRSTCTTRSPTTHCARSLSGVQMQTFSTRSSRGREAGRGGERVVGLELDHGPDDDAHGGQRLLERDELGAQGAARCLPRSCSPARVRCETTR